MSIVRRCLTAAVIVVLLGWLIVSGCREVQEAQEKAAHEQRAREQRYLEHWLAEEKQALVSGKRDSVYLYSTTGTDWIVGRFAGMPEIKSLVFESTDLTDKGLETIAELPNITSLILYGSPGVGDAGLVTLSRNRSLETLSLGNIGVTDDGLAALRSFPCLKELIVYRDVARPRLLTDRAVKHLSTLTKLNKLSVTGGWISDAAIAELEASLPDCQMADERAGP
jgi:hypothetical protein